VAFYFIWQGFYIRALCPLALAGLAIRALRPDHRTVDDDPFLPLYALAAVVWAIVFVQLWRRRQAELAFTWGTIATSTSSNHPLERQRREYVGTPVEDAVTGQTVLVDHWRPARFAVSALVTALCLLLPLAAMFLSLNLQGYVSKRGEYVLGVRVYYEALAHYARPGEIFDPASYLSLLPVVGHAVVILNLNAGYRHVAEALTRFENHRSARGHTDSLLLKRFFFEAFDSYLVLFYVAFELQDVPRLRKEILGLFTSDTVRRVLLETVVPAISQWLSHRSRGRVSSNKKDDAVLRDDAPAQMLTRRDPSWCGDLPMAISKGSSPIPKRGNSTLSSNRKGIVKGAPSVASTAGTQPSDVKADLEQEEYDDFDDFLEMVIQFGYITLFASAAPIVPAIALLCNSIEYVSDLFKLTFLCRRPRLVRAKTIGIWWRLLYLLMLLSIFSNLVLFGVASDQMAAVFPSLFTVPTEARARGLWSKFAGGAAPTAEHEMRSGQGRYVVLLLVALEHGLLLLLLLTEVMPKQPQWVRNAIARRQLDKEAERRRQ